MLPRVISSGVTAHRISKNITFYLNETAALEPSGTPAPVKAKPLLLMMPWLGSQPHAVAKYCDIYFRTGFDVLVVESEVSRHCDSCWASYSGWIISYFLLTT